MGASYDHDHPDFSYETVGFVPVLPGMGVRFV
jgi:hypothetical protein